MKINEEVKELLREYSINVKDGLSYLLMVYFDQIGFYVPEVLSLKVQRTNIFVGEKDGTIKWNIPLFEEQITGFEWVVDWRKSFFDINKERAGTIAMCMGRMKKFFVENPSIRKEDVISATKMYQRSVDNPNYLKSAPKFILEGKGLEKSSILKEWVEKYQSLSSVGTNRTSNRNTMR